MGLCDRLEAQLAERETRQAGLVRASLAQFAADPTPANLAYLFHPSYHIPPAELRKTILTLAVQGKLVPQEAGDEPAENLVSRIVAFRLSEGEKRYADVCSTETPYEIPSTWAWARMGNLAHRSDSGWSPQCDSISRVGSQWGVLKVSAVSWGRFLADENKALPVDTRPRPECEVRCGDFLLSRANTAELVARSVIVDEAVEHLMMSDKIVRFTFSEEIDPRYINMAHSVEFVREYYSRNASGTSNSMKNVGRHVMCNVPLPIPPRAEQQRIVAKVDELMGLCDRLEARLAEQEMRQAGLLRAILYQLMEGK
jgi:type I restriction enzyme S subunit